MKTLFLFLTILLLTPKGVYALCVFKKNPVSLRVQIEACNKNSLRVTILSGLSSDETSYYQNPQEVSHEKIHDNNCKKYPQGSKKEIQVTRLCCDTLKMPCKFGQITSTSGSLIVDGKRYLEVDGTLVEVTE